MKASHTHIHKRAVCACGGVWCSSGCLDQGGLQVAGLAVGAVEALAQAGGVVADTTAGAVTELCTTGNGLVVETGVEATWAALRVGARWALLEGAVGSTEAGLALAAIDLGGVPCACVLDLVVVDLANELGVVAVELLLGLASAVAGAGVGAGGAVAGAALVAGEALADTSLAVADTGVGALGVAVGSVLVVLKRRCVLLGGVDPGELVGAGAQGAVGANPGRHGIAVRVSGAILADVAGALVMGRASAMARAAVGASCCCHAQNAQKDDGHHSGLHCICCGK